MLLKEKDSKLAKIYIIPWQGKTKVITTLHPTPRHAGMYRGSIEAVVTRHDARVPGKLLVIDVHDEVYFLFLDLLGGKLGIERDVNGIIAQVARRRKALLAQTKQDKASS